MHVIYSWENLCPHPEQIPSPLLPSVVETLKNLKGMKLIQAEGTLIISPSARIRKEIVVPRGNPKVSGKHQGEIFQVYHTSM